MNVASPLIYLAFPVHQIGMIYVKLVDVVAWPPYESHAPSVLLIAVSAGNSAPTKIRLWERKVTIFSEWHESTMRYMLN